MAQLPQPAHSLGRPLPSRAHVSLQSEEPPTPQRRASDIRTFFDVVFSLCGRHSDRPGIIAADGRGGSGKTSLASKLAAAAPGSEVLHIDDLDWNEPLFRWDHLLVAALSELRSSGSLDFTPPAWPRHGRKGSIAVAAGAPFVVVEGTGAGMRAVADLIDVCIWVQTDDDAAEERGIRRDTEEGTNGDAEESVRFWHWWMAGERAFFAADRPWERAHLIVSGERLPGLGDNEIAWAEGPI